jgi:hypothetical protein
MAAQIGQAHQLYCELTGQNLTLGFDRERMWFELLRLGYTPEDLRAVIVYLQREIRAQRRNVGALKLTNLLQPDRFEEDLQISRVRLHPSPKTAKPSIPAAAALPEADREKGRERALELLRQIKSQL